MQKIGNELALQPSSLETIDMGLFRYVDETLNLQTITNKGLQKVPVIWLGAERSYQIKHNKELRDNVGKLKLPLMSINRESFELDTSFQGAIKPNLFEQGDYKGGVFKIASVVNQEKTRNFANKDKAKRLKTGAETGKYKNKKIVYDEYYVPTPIYMNVSYTITLRTEFEQQMNDLLSPFIKLRGNSPSNSFFYTIDNHRYEAFIDSSFNESQNSTNLSEEERMFETKVLIKVLGYLTGEGLNRDKPKITRRETVVEIKISRERVISGDQIPWKKKNNKYRE
tara:strand:- start:7886 stop:8731 length:846 start_codon:yes stop_codon:yes gene_type:complete